MKLALKIAAVVVLTVCCALPAYVYLRAMLLPTRNAALTLPPIAATAPSVAQGDSVPVSPRAPERVELAAGGMSVRGTVHFSGQAPDPQQIDLAPVRECAAHHPDGFFDDSLVVYDGRLANVVVRVKFADGQAPPAAAPPTAPAVLDQKGCQYRPHVLAVMVGQPLVVSNSDAFLHNVHALSFANPAFNFGQPTRDPGRIIPALKAPEVFKVKCDVHPWMGAYVHVIDHPFFAVTKEDGTYAIPGGLPDGTYTLVAWHEKLGEKQVTVEVKDGKAEAADFTFALDG